MARVILGVRGAAVLLIVCLGAWGAGAAGAAPVPRPAIDLLSASPNLVSAHGGTVVVHVKVEHSQRCEVRGQRVAFASVKLLRTVDCHAGRATVRIPVAANRYKHSVTLHFSVTAITLTRHDFGAITVEQAAKPTPVPPARTAPLRVTTLAVPNGALNIPYVASLSADGGVGPYAWTIASGTLPPGVALTGDGQLKGTPGAVGQFAFTAQVADARGKIATLSVTISVADSHVDPAPNAPTQKSTNWSGYALGGGPFTSVSGTFNVPTITAGGNSQMSAAEWAGIDGWGPGSNSIIQAGVDESYSPVFGIVTFPWYELYPAPSFPIPMPVLPGDQVTVSISQVSPGLWDLLVLDNTNSQSFNAEFNYTGQQSTAEWIMEAPFSVQSQSVIPLPQFSPVTFSNLAATPTGQPATKFVMFQDGTQVSTPGPLSANGFTVDYGAVTPAAP